MRRRQVVWVLILSGAISACTQAAPTAEPSPAATTDSMPTQASTNAPQPTFEFPLPAELIGTWEAVDISGLTLELKEAGYTIRRVVAPDSPIGGTASGSGRAAVDGNEIVFSNSTICAGDGRYTWAIDDGVLRFTSIEPDACPGRASSIEAVDYARAE